MWWGLLAGLPAGILIGVAATLVLAAAIKTQPMDARTYTGDPTHTTPNPDAEADTFNQIIRDFNNRDRGAA